MHFYGRERVLTQAVFGKLKEHRGIYVDKDNVVQSIYNDGVYSVGYIGGVHMWGGKRYDDRQWGVFGPPGDDGYATMFLHSNSLKELKLKLERKLRRMAL